ncbi:MAG: ABC-2 family transporter protein [Candidatus Schekmanbacteria bacterium]|nr:ABC-2 family transporter protein [Candidatus Schekmanbacteria bacterium]
MRLGLRFYAALVGTNIKASFALRGAFWMQVLFMFLNNAVFFTVWLIFFNRIEEVGGWRLADVAILFGTVATAFGCVEIFVGGTRDLARAIVEGELDAALTQPKSVLVQAVCARTLTSGWGDIASGLMLIGATGSFSAHRAAAVLIAVAASCCVFTATAVIYHSLAFWIGPMDHLGRQMWEAMITFSTYPPPIFDGFLKVLLFTVVPAGFIGYLPAELVRSWSWTGLLAVAGGAAAYLTVAVVVFHAGLRHYQSGSRFGARL